MIRRRRKAPEKAAARTAAEGSGSSTASVAVCGALDQWPDLAEQLGPRFDVGAALASTAVAVASREAAEGVCALRAAHLIAGLIVVAPDADDDAVAALLAAGADDVVRDGTTVELAARVRALARRQVFDHW